MIKRFCDVCGQQMKEDMSLVWNGPGEAVLGVANVSGRDVMIIARYATKKPEEDLCKYCILDALYTLDDREKDGQG